MADLTPNLALRRPAGPDVVNVVTDISNNMTKIDNTFAVEAPSNFSPVDAASAGSSGRVARADHKHGSAGFGVPVDIGTSNAAGVALTLSRSDHVHKGIQYLNHGPETFDINVGVIEDIIFYAPTTPISATLILRGRALVAGLLPAHTHTGTTSIESIPHAHTASSASNGGEVLTSGNGGSHGHPGSTISNESAHTHSFTTGAGSSHNHVLTADTGSAGAIQIDVGNPGVSTNQYITAEAAHTHGGTTNAGSSHTHTPTISTASDHTHSITTSNHQHNITVDANTTNHTHTFTSASTGVGGFIASTRPAGVTVTINGVDRTVALAGPFGTSGTDWNQASLNILPYITTSGWHTIEFGCTTGGRLKSQILLSL